MRSEKEKAGPAFGCTKDGARVDLLRGSNSESNNHRTTAQDLTRRAGDTWFGDHGRARCPCNDGAVAPSPEVGR